LVCKLPPEDHGLEKLVELIESAGYKVNGDKIFGETLEAELKATSLREDEAILLIRTIDLKSLERFLRVLTRGCWYVDIYYHLRGERAYRATENLGLSVKEKAEVRRMKIADVSLKLDLYSRLGALTISYRAGWREVNRGVVAKVHERILGKEPKSGILGRLLRWGR